jgi:hypothetical protein
VTSEVGLRVIPVADAPVVTATRDRLSLDLSAVLVDLDGSEVLTSVVLAGIPKSATLSVGTKVGNDWVLTAQEANASDVIMTFADGSSAAAFTLVVTAYTTDSVNGIVVDSNASSVQLDVNPISTTTSGIDVKTIDRNAPESEEHYMLAGDDTVNIANSTSFSYIDGGSGVDTLFFVNNANVSLDLTQGKVQGFETIHMNQFSNSSTLTLNLSSLLTQSSTTDILFVRGGAADKVDLLDFANWTKSATTTSIGGVNYFDWTNAQDANAHLYIQSTITQVI